METLEYGGDAGDVGLGYDGDIQNEGYLGYAGNAEDDKCSDFFWSINTGVDDGGSANSGDLSHSNEEEAEPEKSSGTSVSPVMSQQPSNSGLGLPATVRARRLPGQRPNPDQTVLPATKTSTKPTATKETSSNPPKQCGCRRSDAPKCNTFDSFRRCLGKVNPRNEWGVAFGYCDNCLDKECHKKKKIEPAIKPQRCRCGWAGRRCRLPESCLGAGTTVNEGPNGGWWCDACAITCSEAAKKSCTCAVTSYRACEIGSEACTKIYRGRMTSPLSTRYCAPCMINGCCKEE